MFFSPVWREWSNFLILWSSGVDSERPNLAYQKELNKIYLKILKYYFGVDGKSCVPNLEWSFSLKQSLGVCGNNGLPGVIGLRLEADTLDGRIGFRPLFFLAYLLEFVPVPPSWFCVFSPFVASSPEVEVGLGFCQPGVAEVVFVLSIAIDINKTKKKICFTATLNLHWWFSAINIFSPCKPVHCFKPSIN
jgi:hypothetical protein